MPPKGLESVRSCGLIRDSGKQSEGPVQDSQPRGSAESHGTIGAYVSSSIARKQIDRARGSRGISEGGCRRLAPSRRNCWYSRFLFPRIAGRSIRARLLLARVSQVRQASTEQSSRILGPKNRGQPPPRSARKARAARAQNQSDHSMGTRTALHPLARPT